MRRGATSCGSKKTLEDANIKLDSVITDIIGVSGRKIIEALIAGESDPAKLASLADRRVKASQPTLREALRGRVTTQHRFLLRLHLDQIDALDAAIARIDREVGARAASGHAGATLAKNQRGGSGTKGVRYAHFTDQ